MHPDNPQTQMNSALFNLGKSRYRKYKQWVSFYCVQGLRIVLPLKKYQNVGSYQINTSARIKLYSKLRSFSAFFLLHGKKYLKGQKKKYINCVKKYKEKTSQESFLHLWRAKKKLIEINDPKIDMIIQTHYLDQDSSIPSQYMFNVAFKNILLFFYTFF